MRQGTPSRRSRGRGPRKPHIPTKQQTFDSAGPDIRVRGNAYQVWEKYLGLARDAQSAGDRVAAENFFQHAEHYYRLLNANGADPATYNGRPRYQPRPEDGEEEQPVVQPVAQQPQPGQQEQRQERQDRPERQERQERHEPRPAREGRPRHQPDGAQASANGSDESSEGGTGG